MSESTSMELESEGESFAGRVLARVAAGGISRATVLAVLTAAEEIAAADDAAAVEAEVAEAKLLGMKYTDGIELDVTIARRTAAHLVAGAKAFLTATGAENYVEQHVHDRETGERYTLTVQRPGKRTPHDLRRAAEAQRDWLLDRVDELTAARFDRKFPEVRP